MDMRLFLLKREGENVPTRLKIKFISNLNSFSDNDTELEEFSSLKEMFGGLSGALAKSDFIVIAVTADIYNKTKLKILKALSVPTEENAELKVYVSCNDRSLEIVIEDNGKGMDPEIIEKINRRDFETLKGNTNIGISNVVTRLEMYYGKDGKMRAVPDMDKGSRIVIDIPLKKKTD